MELNKEYKIKKKTYVRDERLITLANEVIKKCKDTLFLGDAVIHYMLVYPNINKNTLGTCRTVNPITKLYSDCDYIISLSGEVWDKSSDMYKEILLEHELRHINAEEIEEGVYKYKQTKHDINDFRAIIERHGMDWVDEANNLTYELYGEKVGAVKS